MVSPDLRGFGWRSGICVRLKFMIVLIASGKNKRINQAENMMLIRLSNKLPGYIWAWSDLPAFLITGYEVNYLAVLQYGWIEINEFLQQFRRFFHTLLQL